MHWQLKSSSGKILISSGFFDFRYCLETYGWAKNLKLFYVAHLEKIIVNFGCRIGALEQRNEYIYLFNWNKLLENRFSKTFGAVNKHRLWGISA